jgi:nucleotide-binding universal stress UspA family protein
LEVKRWREPPDRREAEVRSPSRILVVLEGRDDDEEVIEAVGGVAGEDSEVLLVMVVSSFRTVPSFDVILLYDFAAEAARAHDHLDEVVRRLSHPRVRTLVRISPLSAAEVGLELVDIAGEERCDLLVMAVRPQTRHAVAFLLRQTLPLVLVPTPDRPRSSPRGRRVPLPRLGLIPALRPGTAVGSVFFFFFSQGDVAAWDPPAEPTGP